MAQFGPLSGSALNGVNYGSGATVSGVTLPYSLTEEFDIRLTPDNSTTMDALIKVPEPAGLALIGSGLLLLGSVLRRNLVR